MRSAVTTFIMTLVIVFGPPWRSECSEPTVIVKNYTVSDLYAQILIEFRILNSSNNGKAVKVRCSVTNTDGFEIGYVSREYRLAANEVREDTLSFFYASHYKGKIGAVNCNSLPVS